MKLPAHSTAGPSPAFVLLDAARVPTYANAEALRLLRGSKKPSPEPAVDLTLLSTALLAAWPANSAPLDGQIVPLLSQRRRYYCQLFRLTSTGAGAPAYLLMIDRAGALPADELLATERYSLTHREAELLRYLTTGLTNKEIGERMQISPNTVKAFLKLMMAKMGVSTRAAVVGRAFEGRAKSAAHAAGR